jgi:hypothetical protein
MTIHEVMPKRSGKDGIGKDIGGAVYLHRHYEDRLGTVLTEARKKIPTDFEYQVVKYNYRSETVSFIQCLDFDVAPEPTVGQIILVSHDGLVRRRQQPRNPEIYHHKWLFVADDYEGFNVEESKRRSLRWLRLKDIDHRRIGRRSYWEQIVLPRLVDEDDA